MPEQQERPDEAAAAHIVRTHCPTNLDRLDYSGGTGGIDYTGLRAGNRVILEVTRFTRPELRRDWEAARANLEEPMPLRASHSWWVTFDGHPHYSGLPERVAPALRTFENHGLFDYYNARMDWWLRHVPTLSDALGILRSERVVAAKTIRLDDSSSPSMLFVSPSGSWTFSGSDRALEEVEAYLDDEGKHLAKTSAEPANERHLFIWIDSATPEEFSRALSEDTYWESPPSRAPRIPPNIDHVWLIHEGLARGWHWERLGPRSSHDPTDGWSLVRT